MVKIVADAKAFIAAGDLKATAGVVSEIATLAGQVKSGSTGSVAQLSQILGGAPPAPAIADGMPQPRPAMVYRPGCRTQAQTVPSEFGGTRTVNITRCY